MVISTTALMQVFLNGQFVPGVEASLPLHDSGFVLGATVTDLCRTFRHRLFRLADHVARFRQSCNLAWISLADPDHEIALFAKELVDKNSHLLRPEQDLILVMFATPGLILSYAGIEDDSGNELPTFGMHTFPLPSSRYAPLFRQGAHLVVPTTQAVPVSSIDPRIKHRSRLHWWIAGREAEQMEKGAWALLTDANGYVTETAAANFLIVKDGVVCTPPRSTILGGISLLTVEEICQELGIPFQERPVTLEDCLKADEALLTGTAFCVAGVSRINSASIPWPGQVFEKLLDAWNQWVGLDIRAQILSGG
jgi:branched-subunit amino acid aminotransferase/4-amino-4-deoxychorismate lyase